MHNNFLEQYNQYKISKDFFKSTIIHIIIITIIFIFSFLQNKLTFFKHKSTVTSNFINIKSNTINKNVNANTKNVNSPVTTANNIPVKASLIDPNMVNQAILRQELQIKEKINREKKIEQQEQQVAALKKAAEQETVRLKKESQKIEAYNKQLQNEQKKLKQQAEALSLEQKKLKQQADALSLEQKKLKQQALNSELIDKKKNLKNSESFQHEGNQATELGNSNNSNNLENLSMIQNEISIYHAKWKNEIINNRKKIMFLPNNMTCVVRIKLLPNGHLALVKIEQSSGNSAYDKFSEQAIHKSAPFEMPEDPVLNEELTNTEHIIHFDEDSFSD